MVLEGKAVPVKNCKSEQREMRDAGIEAADQ